MSQFVCPHCGAGNRVPEGRDARAAKCGKCHRPVLTGEPVEVTGAQLEAHKLGTRGAALLLDVWAPWCGPCRAMAPMFERAAKELEPGVRVLKLNADNAPGVSSRLGITGIPTLLLLHGGREISRSSGAMDAPSIVAWTKAGLAGT